ncbi:replicative protein [Lentilactobacillus hilgardii]|uniref:rolling circle replication-associated protein n=1 Tax=Lentilactobacillus hilgardii TaxID=1588 RepID=UPI0039EAD0AE
MSKKNKIIIKSKTLVKSYRYGSTLELTTAAGNHYQGTKVLPGKRYVVLSTGEIKNMKTDAKNRADNLKSVKSTMRKLRRLIAHNFNGGLNQLWITLTYAVNVTDTHIVMEDFKLFIRRLREQYDNLDYISVIEPQASGRWHLHLLLKQSSGERLTIQNTMIADLWRKGFTKTKRLSNADKVANYVLAYLTNLDIPNGPDSTSKKYVKGARLYLYPKGLRIYRRSKGINDPPEMTDFKSNILAQNNVTNSEADFAIYRTHETPDGYKVSYTTEYYNNLEMRNRNE